MDRHAGGFAQRHQARHDRFGIAIGLGQHLAMIIGRDAAHIIVDGRDDRDRILGHVDARKNARAFRNARQPLVQHFGIEMIEMQEDVVAVLADATAFADFDGHGARDDVTRREVLGRRGVTLHEALALGIGDVTALAARALGDQAA